MRKEIYSQDSKDAFHDRLNRNKNYQEKLLEWLIFTYINILYNNYSSLFF